MISRSNYSIFLLFKENIKTLKSMRPSVWLKPNDEFGHSIVGDLTKQSDFFNSFESHLQTVRVINSSIILNATSYFEGFIENLILRHLDKTSDLPDRVKPILDEYKNKVIQASSLDELRKYFKIAFSLSFGDMLANRKMDLIFIENFYVLRHLLVHGSIIETISKDNEDGGTQIIHTAPVYQKFIECINNRYSLGGKFNSDFLMVLMFSDFVDDFTNTLFSISDEIVSHLSKLKLFNLDDFWGDYKSVGIYGSLSEMLSQEFTARSTTKT